MGIINESAFIKTMYRHNENLLDHLVSTLTQKQGRCLSILDLSEGAGDVVASLLRRNIDADYTLVESSKEQLNLAQARLGEGIDYRQSSSEDFLSSCAPETYDVIIGTGAFKDMQFRDFIKESRRVIKPGGKIAIMIGLKDSMPELKKLYYKLLVKHREKITKFIIGTPYPSSRKEVERVCNKNDFKKIICQEARQVFGFASGKRFVRWLLSTGILTDYEEMLNLRNKQVRESFIQLIEEEQIEWITHKFVYGIWEKN